METPDEYLMLKDVILLRVVPTLGVPGNILSAIVWIRRRQTSSAVYLAALAINDLSFVLVLFLLQTLFPHEGLSGYVSTLFNMIAEPLLVLAFSVERLIAIVRPLQVWYMRLNFNVCRR